MKLAYKHIVHYINSKPSIEDISHKLFQLGHEHEIDDGIFIMEFTPNRGDCLSIKGILRDLAIFYDIDLNRDLYNQEIANLPLKFENRSPEICPKISFLKIEINGMVSEYKGVLNDYFSDLKIKKNNFYTDVSNYISYETGQPTHCYDASKIEGCLSFSEITEDQDFDTLLDKKIRLKGKNAVFLLDKSVINLAGVVGGKSTSCSVKTKSVIVECAYFKPESIIGKSVIYDIQSEAAHKFERGVDPECHEEVLRRFAQIIEQHIEIKSIKLFSGNYQEFSQKTIQLDVSKINKILGVSLSEDGYKEYLNKLGFDVIKSLVLVPSYRSDVETENDLAEEVARAIGYDSILPIEFNINNHFLDPGKIEKKIKSFFIDNGFFEVINAPFTSSSSSESIKVDNPLDSNRKLLRTSLRNSLIDNLLYNERRQKDSIKLFEISDIYTKSNSIQKQRRLGLIASGRVGKNYKDFSKKINHDYLNNFFKEYMPEQLLNIEIIPRDKLDTKIKNQILYLEINLEDLNPHFANYESLSANSTDFIQYQTISEFPSSTKDISFSVKDSSKCKFLEESILSYKHSLLKEVFIFDYYNNEKMLEIKIGFRFIFQSRDGTITEGKVKDVMSAIIKKAMTINTVTIPGLK